MTLTIVFAMRPSPEWITVGLASVGIGMAALVPAAWVAYAFIGVGTIIVVLAILGRWFKVVRRDD